MSIDTKTKTIGKTIYDVRQLPSKEGQAMLIELLNVAGPSIGDALATFDPALLKGAIGKLGPEALDSKLSDLDASKVALIIPELAKVILPVFAPALAGIARSLDPKTFASFASRLAKRTVIGSVDDEEGKKRVELVTVYDVHFAGAYRELFAWFWFALTVNFAGFLGDTTD